MKTLLKHINKMSGATVGSLKEGVNSRDDSTLTQSIFQGLSDLGTIVGGAVRSVYETAMAGIAERRQIVRQSLNDFYNMDSNKNSNLGYVIVIGIAIITVFVYKFLQKHK